MNQTTWIIGGGVVLLLLAGALYVFTGAPRAEAPTASSETKNIIDSNTETSASIPVTEQPAKETVPPITNKETKSINMNDTQQLTSATIKTNQGEIVVKLFPADAPKTVENFTKLAKEGYYNGIKFHRVIKGFMIQGGDPLSKDDTKVAQWGTGGPGYTFADEINPSAAVYQKGYKRGVLAMANAGPNTNGSQFFIMHADYPLPPNYTIFGEVVSGIDVVDKIANIAVDRNDRPFTAQVIESMIVR